MTKDEMKQRGMRRDKPGSFQDEEPEPKRRYETFSWMVTLAWAFVTLTAVCMIYALYKLAAFVMGKII